jgi:hypothetical protein
MGVAGSFSGAAGDSGVSAFAAPGSVSTVAGLLAVGFVPQPTQPASANQTTQLRNDIAAILRE